MRPSRLYLRASLWTLVTSGQVASITCRFRSCAARKSSGPEPCAENTTFAPSGISRTSSTVTAPRASSDLTTVELCTISCFRYTGGPYRSSASSTTSIARSTPAQKPRGAAR